MASLARREDLAGKVQMIYLDPPYGIKFASNFQPQLGQRDVKDREQDLTREPEMVKAYRDTWTLGIHSYLAYLRDRLAIPQNLACQQGGTRSTNCCAHRSRITPRQRRFDRSPAIHRRVKVRAMSASRSGA